jgi:hypothetical protein
VLRRKRRFVCWLSASHLLEHSAFAALLVGIAHAYDGRVDRLQ